jgi:hypothetical protein
LPDTSVRVALDRVRLRWRIRSIAFAVALGGASFAIALIAATMAFESTRVVTIVVSLLAGAVATTIHLLRQPRVSVVDAARAIEDAIGGLDNLIVTATELSTHPRPVRDEIRLEIDRQAADRVRSADVRRVVPLIQPIAVAIVVLIGCALLARVPVEPRAMRTAVVPLDAASTPTGGSFTVTVSPPPYTHRSVEVIDAPPQVTVIAGSRVRVETARALVRDWIATESAGLEIRTSDTADSLFLSVLVVPDAPPTVRIVAPGKDTAFPTPSGELAIRIESADDLGLSSLSLRLTKASGGGENVKFTEGDVPLTIERRDDRHWLAHGTLALGSLALADGDIVVYRAIAHDTNPHSLPVQSEQYLIEIGKTSQFGDAGFALPAEEKKYAISQQMVIYRTEQLLRSRQEHPKDWLEQTQTVAVEQRMVRAEVVFLGGGEVQDEVEEAAQSDELTEGRLQNTGRAEMLRAINAMSRAEAQLNDGKAAEALVFEREALASLERALDRRRFFLRTLPERSRIDATRRLSGERGDARSWLRERSSSAASTTLDAHRQVMRDLAAAAVSGGRVDASLATRIAALDPASVDLQKAAVRIAAAGTADARREAVQFAMQAVTAHALGSMPPSTPIGLGADPLAGRLADQLKERPR